MRATGSLAAVGALALGISAVGADDHPPDGLVVFVNASSSSVSISVDGASLCSIDPGSQCSTELTGDADTDHDVAGEMDGRTWTDMIRISECHWNWLGTKTYTFRDDSVPFACVK